MNKFHIDAAIAQAKKEGNKGVVSITGGIDQHHKYSKLILEGKLETFIQNYEICGIESSCQLLRKPKK